MYCCFSSYTCCRVSINEANMLSKLCSMNFDQEKEVQKSVYLQFEDNRAKYESVAGRLSLIHRAEVLEFSDGTFKLKEFWCPKPIHTYKADFLCHGRYM